MADSRVYSKEVAERILNEFPQAMLDNLLSLAEQAEQSDEATSVVARQQPIELPEGWYYQVCSNCIIVRYSDGEQERKTFFVPQILINYARYVNEKNPRIKRSIFERLAFGLCSCGKPIRFAQLLLKSTDMIKAKSLPTKAAGYALSVVFGIWTLVRPSNLEALMYNQHPKCL